MNGTGKNGFYNNGEMPALKDPQNDRIRPVISTLNADYDIDEFQSLVLKKHNDAIKKAVALDALHQYISVQRWKNKSLKIRVHVAEGSVSRMDLPARPMTGTDKKLKGERREPADA